MTVRCLDALIGENGFSDCNFIKIDTDGHDFEVLKGLRKAVAEMRPAVLFESFPVGSPTYIEDFVSSMRSFAEAGYANAIAYDNFGQLFGVFDVGNLREFHDALFYQLTGKFEYFDILLLRKDDFEPFIASEVAHFIANVPDEPTKRAARLAADLSWARGGVTLWIVLEKTARLLRPEPCYTCGCRSAQHTEMALIR